MRIQGFGAVLFVTILFAGAAHADEDDRAQVLPTGKRVTPLATAGADFQSLNPGLKQFPDYLAGQAMSMALSPDRRTLLVLTSGYNRMNGRDGKPIPDASDEYVFVYDATAATPHLRQVLKVPNTFAGLAFHPDGKHFYVSGGVDDNLHCFARDANGSWSESGPPVKLNHAAGGLGLMPAKEPLAAGGVAVTPDGRFVLVANTYNDSVSMVDAQANKVSSELDLRPGKNDPGQHGVPGGEYPFWIATKSASLAYVSCLRDREIVEIELSPKPRVTARIKLEGNPNKMTLNQDRSRLYVTSDNTDTVSVIDTRSNRVIETINTTAPPALFSNPKQFTGSGPNDATLSDDERTLYVSNGGTNSVAVIQLGRPSKVIGLIPTGWYPNALAVSRDNSHLFIANSKSAPGPNPNLHIGVKDGSRPGPAVNVESLNQYVLQLEKAGLLTLPVPNTSALSHLTRIVAENNALNAKPDPHDTQVMAALHSRVKHIVYIIKENRTYDQVLGDLGKGNGNPSLTEFGEKITPNLHAIARHFVDLDNFFNSGEVSGDGWPWSTSGRESDFGQKAVPLNYAGRGTNYEYEGTNRDINVGLATVRERKAANPKTPDDPDLLPGAINVAAPDGPKDSPQGKGYIWDAVLRAGLTFREYGCMSDTALDSPRDPHPFQNHVIMSRPANPELYKFGDPYYRGFDPGYPDFFREAEWEREFDNYVAHQNLPSFEIVQLPVDHMGEFKSAIAGVNTPEAQQADNDYATARLIDHVAHSPYRDSTLIFILEDDAQDGPDHVDAHRSTAYIVGPYVKQGAVVSSYYTTVSMLRTIEDILGLEHLNLNTATTRPMTDVFDLNQKTWTLDARPSAVLLKTQLPLSREARRSALQLPSVEPKHGSGYWAAQTAGFDFSAEDRIDAQAFNRILWRGLMPGPYPERP